MPFPGIAFAVSPAPESGTENTQIVESDSTPAETSSSVQAATSDSTPAATPNNVQAAAPDNIQSTVPESTQTAAPNNIQTAAPDNAQAQSSDSAPAATSDGAPAETSGGTQAEATDKETLPLLIIVAGFSNVSYRDDFDWAEAIFNGDESLAAYYDDMSLGQFTFVPMNETCSHESGDTTNKADKANDGIVHVTLELEHSDWTVPGSEIFMSTFGSALLEMIKAADRFVDFASYDTNHDGELSSDEAALGFVIAGYEAAVTRDYSNMAPTSTCGRMPSGWTNC